MPNTETRQSPRLSALQGLWTLLPTFVLAWVGVYYVVQDRKLVFRDAQVSGQFLAEHLAETIQNEFQKRIVDEVYERAVNEVESRQKAGKGFEEKQRAVSIRTSFSEEWISAWPDQRFGWVWPRGIHLDSEGRLAGLGDPPYRPGAYDPLPAPREFDLSALSGGQRALWDSIVVPAATNALNSTVASLASNVEDGELPEPFQSNAAYRLAMAFSANGRWTQALNWLDRIAANNTVIFTENGLPLKPLAALKALEIRSAKNTTATPEPAAADFESYYELLLRHPSFLTPKLFEKGMALESRVWGDRSPEDVIEWEQWKTDESSRRFFNDLTDSQRQRLSAQGWLWKNWENEDWLVRRRSNSDPGEDSNEANNMSAAYLEVYSAALIRATLNAIIQGSPIAIPVHASVETTLFDKRLLEIRPSLSEQPATPDLIRPEIQSQSKDRPMLASVSLPFSESDSDPDSLRVQVLLANPSALYARQRSRLIWILLVILAAAAASSIGYLGLLKAYRKQIALNDRQSNFVSSVSHELRAPIASMWLMAEGLEQNRVKDHSRQKEYFHLMAQECRRLTALIENVLDVARIDQGRKQYEFEPTDLAALVNETIQIMKPAASEKGVRLLIRSDEPTKDRPLDPILDARSIQQALINLLDNAVKHSPPNKPVVVEVRREGGNANPFLRLSVEDLGPGIPSDQRERIFERFHRLGAEMTRDTQGVGIGLNIVKHIVEAHHGTVHVEPKKPQGSRFVIRLPWQCGR